MIDISVIVVTYNPELSKLYKTLDSIICQKGISFEIILCDDGSKVRFDDEIYRYFSTRNFVLYEMVFHDRNEGTVSNYFSGLEKAKGKYTKLISPGDYLVGEFTLYDWIHFLEEKGAEWSFSDIFCHRSDMGNDGFFKARAYPQIILPYLRNDPYKCAWNYLALCDIANGAAIIGTTRVQMRFCEMIRNKGIRYAEDSIWRLMMFDEVVGCYFPKAAVCYEYGTGISSSSDPIWKERLKKDWKLMIQIMLEETNISARQKKIVKAAMQTSKFKKLFIWGKLRYWLKYHFHPRLTDIPKESRD